MITLKLSANLQQQEMQWAKKHGAGSKGTWGKPGDELVKNAPMYDSDEEDAEAMQAKFTEEVKMKMSADRLVAEEFEPIIMEYTKGEKRLSKPALEEFQDKSPAIYAEVRDIIETAYIENDAQGFFKYLSSLSSQLKTVCCKRMIQIALERGDAEQKLCIGFLKNGYMKGALQKYEVRRGIDLICADLDDSLKDNPHAISDFIGMLKQLTLVEHMFNESVFFRLPLVVLGLPSVRDFLSSELGEKASGLLNLEKIKEEIVMIVKEVINNNLSEAAMESLEIFCETKKAMLFPLQSLLIRKAIEYSLDKGDKEREVCSQLLLLCKEKYIFNSSAYSYAFDDVIERAEMLEPDCPEFVRIVSRFISRCIMDDCLSEQYVNKGFLLSPENALGKSILFEAFAILKEDPSVEAGKKIWDTSFSNKDIKEKFDLIIKSYFTEFNKSEVILGLNKLKCEFYLHEFVKRLCICAFEKCTIALDEPIAQVVDLLKNLEAQNIVHKNMIAKGVYRVKQMSAELSPDIPCFDTLLERLEKLIAATI